MRMSWLGALGIGALVGVGSAGAEVLTADRAVQIALLRSTQAVQAEAAVLDARAGLFRSYSGVLPRVSASVTRFGSRIDDNTSLQFVRDPSTGEGVITTLTLDEETYGTTPTVQGTWSVLDLQALSNLSAGRRAVQAARLSRTATRQDLALAVRRQFYEVVRAVQLARVASEALRLSRDDERRVDALFEVGSVSRSDQLSARVRTAQSVLDSLTAHQAALNQRIVLAALMGVPESETAEVDTVLAAQVRDFDETALLAEAEQARPDLRAAEASWRSARAGVSAARFARLPYVTVSGQATFNSKSSSLLRGSSETDRDLRGSIALNLDLFDFAIDGGSAAARAQELRARDAYESLRRNLAGEVRQALLAYREAVERRNVAESAIAAAEENVKLTQQKYNVGSATILDLINAQVQLQRAKSDQVSAQAAIRVAEAALDRVRGRGE